MPELQNYRVIIFKEDSSLSKRIIYSNSMKEFLLNNIEKIQKDNGLKFKSIEFTSQDSDLYASLHYADIRNCYKNKNEDIVLEVRDLYNFNKKPTSVKSKVGLKLQEKGELKPFYIIVKVKIPKYIWKIHYNMI